MTGMFGKKAGLSQANGPEIELIVTGTQHRATYETLDGMPAIYDPEAGLYCFAIEEAGTYRSTAVPVTSPPPPGVKPRPRRTNEIQPRLVEEE